MNNTQINLSFVIPCYNAGNYIGLCLDSIFSCPIPKEDYEVLCVDDCSTDNTKEILHSYANSHLNLRIIQHSNNLGPGASRNTGTDSAKGEYIWFVDADDTIQTDSVDALLNKAIENKPDVLCFNYYDLDNEGGRIGSPRVFKDTDIMTGLDFVYDTFEKGLIYHIGYPVRFLSRKDYLYDKKIYFPKGVYFEDTVWMPKLLLLANKVQGYDFIGYNYWHHGSSIIGTFESNPSAKKIYDWSLVTGQHLYDFSKELRLLGEKYHEYSDIFREYAIGRYVNYLPVLIGRASPREINGFYKLVLEQENAFRTMHKDVLSKASILTKLLLRPLGRWAANICSFYYKLTH